MSNRTPHVVGGGIKSKGKADRATWLQVQGGKRRADTVAAMARVAAAPPQRDTTVGNGLAAIFREA